MRYSVSSVIITDFSGEIECHSLLHSEVYENAHGSLGDLCVPEITPKELDSLNELSLVLWMQLIKAPRKTVCLKEDDWKHQAKH